MDEQTRVRYFLEHMAKATRVRYRLDKPSIGIRCAYAFVREFGPDWHPKQVAEAGRAFWLDEPNVSKKCVTYIDEWLAEQGLTLKP